MAKSTKTDVAPDRAPIFVKVCQLGSEVHEYGLNGARTVKAALEAAGLNAEGADKIRVNGQPATLEQELENEQIVTIAGRIEGAL